MLVLCLQGVACLLQGIALVLQVRAVRLLQRTEIAQVAQHDTLRALERRVEQSSRLSLASPPPGATTPGLPSWPE